MYKKRILRLLAAAVIFIGAMGADECVLAAGDPGDGFTYEVEDGRLTIYGIGDMNDFVSGNSTEAPWRSFGDTIKSVVVSPGVTSIGAEAFYNMHGIRSVELPLSVTTVGTAAFANCSALTSFSAPGLTNISGYAFQDTKIEEFKIPSRLINISYLAFYSAEIGKFTVDPQNKVYSSLYGVLMDKNLETLIRYPCGNGESEFEVFYTVKTIGRHAFEGSKLTSIDLKNTITIKESAFQGCNNLSEIEFPPTLETIEEHAFYACGGLKTVKLNEGIINILNGSFSGTAIDHSIEIPDSAVFVHQRAFPENVELTCDNPTLHPYGINGYRITEAVAVPCAEEYDKAFELMKLINNMRTKEGLRNLYMNEEILEYAMQRAAETAVFDSAVRPDSSESIYGLKSKEAKLIAECRQEGSKFAGTAFDKIIDRAADKSVLMSENADLIGVGCITNDDRTYWTIITADGEGSSNCQMPDNKESSREVAIAAGEYSLTTDISVTFEKPAIEIGEDIAARGCTKNAYMQVKAVFSNTDSGFEWESSDTEVASIDKDGVITGEGNGTAVITVTSKNGLLKGTANISVGTGSDINMYRVFDPKTGEHLYTKDSYEKSVLISAGWEDEGIAWICPERSDRPVYRLFNPDTGEHHYTADKYEYKILKAGEWDDEGIAWYSDPEEGVEIYRLFKPEKSIGGHHYTADANEKKYLGKNDWNYEGIAWYGRKPPSKTEASEADNTLSSQNRD